MSNARLFVEPIMGEEELLRLACEEDRRAVEAFGSAHRRREALMWRHIVRRETGGDVRLAYAPTGSPFLIGRSERIGVSHSGERVAVIISEERCAVDIERLDRDFRRVGERYMTGGEQALDTDSRLPAAIWCAKETLYKYSGRKGLNLRDDLGVEAVDFAGGTIVGHIKDGAAIEMRMFDDGEYLVVYIG